MTELKLSPAPLYPHQKFDEALAKEVAKEVQEVITKDLKSATSDQADDLIERAARFMIAFGFIMIHLKQGLIPDWVKEVAFCDGNKEAMRRWFMEQMESMKEKERDDE